MVILGELPIGLTYSVRYQAREQGQPVDVTIVWEVTAHQHLGQRVFSQLRFVSASLPALPGGVGPTEFKENQHV